MKKIIIGFALTLAGTNGLSNELCSAIGPDALVQRFERCGEGEICGVLTDGSLCEAFQRNYNKSFEISKEASLFRDLFYTHLSAVEKQKAHLTVLPVPKDLFAYPEDGNFDASEKSYFNKQLEYSANELSIASRDIPFNDLSEQVKANESVATFILIKGSPSESNVHEPFAYDGMYNSSYHKKWKAAVQAAPVDKRLSSVFSLSKLDMTSLPIEHLVDVFSYDDEDGRELVRVISFKTPIDAYESNDDDVLVTKLYSERLEKLESMMGPLTNSFIVGHSLGGLRALNMITQLEARQEKPQWYLDLKGVITLAATLWGGQVATEAKKEGTAHSQIMEAMEVFSSLAANKTSKDERENIRKTLLGAEMLLTGYFNSTNAVRVEGVNIVDRNYIQMAMLARKTREIFEKDIGSRVEELDMSPQKLSAPANIDPATQMLLHTLNLGEHLANGKIYEKIARILGNSRKKLAATQPDLRKDWFRNNTLPTRLRYISLSLTLPDPYSHLLSEGSMLRQVYDDAYLIKDSADYQIQRSVHLSSFASDFIPMSDGTTTVEMSQFQARRHMLLNPDQQRYKAENIGLLLSDHISGWLASTVDKDVSSEFPRGALIKALSSYVNSTN